MRCATRSSLKFPAMAVDGLLVGEVRRPEFALEVALLALGLVMPAKAGIQ